MAKVYRARHPKTGLRVAIKQVLKEEIEADPTLGDRFLAEASTMARLHHPNIVAIYYYGEDDGLPYIAMEYLEGRDLDTVVEKGSNLSLLEKVQIIAQVAAGLAYVHQQGMAHRDIKPANIMWLRDGSVKIMDFGIARKEDVNVGRRMTQKGQLVGTGAYLAPEQIKGSDANALSDIYAFGLVCYELLTGRRAVEAPTWHALTYRIVNENPDPIPTFFPECPEALVEAVENLLAKDPDDRFRSIEDFDSEIQPLLHQLRHKESDRLVNVVQEHVDELKELEQLDQARGKLRKAIQLNPTNQEAQALRRDLDERLRRRRLGPRVESLVKEAHSLLSQRKVQESIEKLQSAVQIDPEHTDARIRLEETLEFQQKIQEADSLIREAEQEIQQAHLTEAYGKAIRARDKDPDNPELAGLLQRIREEPERRDHGNSIQEALKRSEEALGIGDFYGALKELDRIDKQYPGSKEVAEQRERISREKEQHRRRTLLESEIQKVRRLVETEFFGQAVDRLEQLEDEFPGDDEVERLLSDARKKFEEQTTAKAISDGRRDVEAYLKDQDLDRARSVVEGLAKAYPGDSRATELLERIRKAQERESALAEAEELNKQQRFPEATLRLEKAVVELGDDPALQEALARVWQKQQEREAAVTKPANPTRVFGTRPESPGEWSAESSDPLVGKTRFITLEGKPGSSLITVAGCSEASYVGRTCAIDHFPFRIGRGQTDFPLPFDAAVSGEHVEVDFRNGGYTIEDLHSSNGTYVNGKRLTSGEAAPLLFGARIQLGTNTQLVFTSKDLCEMPDLTGCVIADRYILSEKLHASSKSALYIARHQGLKRDFAIKVLSPHLARFPGYQEQFEREAQTASGLVHSSICRVLDFGKTTLGEVSTDGSLFVCMDLMSGGSLSRMIEDQETVTVGRMANWLDRICAALAYVHENDFVHGGLKPSSIVFNDEDEAFLTDFALATRLGEKGAHAIVGSPGFLSPEQWRGEVPAPATDQYSLAAVLYLVLTGVLPYDGQEHPEIRAHNFLRKVPPADELAAASGRLECPRSISVTLDRALSVEVSDRFPGILDFASAFRDSLTTSIKVKTRKTEVFVSYHRPRSGQLANLVQFVLEREHPFRVALDIRERDTGGQFPKKIEGLIQNCDVFVCLLAADTLTSPWVNKEIEIASREGKPMIPILQESFQHPAGEEAPACVRELLDYEGVIWLDERNLYVDAALRDLVGLIRQYSEK